MAQKKGEIVVGLDIGTTKICCIVGEVNPGGIDVIGIGTHPSRGLRKGVVINIEATVSSIHKAVEEAELMAGAEISAVYAGIAGGHIRGCNWQTLCSSRSLPRRRCWRKRRRSWASRWWTSAAARRIWRSSPAGPSSTRA